MLTALYAIPIAVLYLALSARVILYRRANRIGLGDKGDNRLLKRMRAHANCAEYAPLGLVLMLLVEHFDRAPLVIHVAGGLLVAGRAAHAYGFSAAPPVMKLRVAGMMLTFGSYVVSILGLAVLVFIGP